MWTFESRLRYDRSKLRYPSDLTDEEWGLIKPPTLPPGDNLHHAIHPHTSTAALRSYLRRQEDQTQTALGGGIRGYVASCL